MKNFSIFEIRTMNQEVFIGDYINRPYYYNNYSSLIKRFRFIKYVHSCDGFRDLTKISTIAIRFFNYILIYEFNHRKITMSEALGSSKNIEVLEHEKSEDFINEIHMQIIPCTKNIEVGEKHYDENTNEYTDDQHIIISLKK